MADGSSAGCSRGWKLFQWKAACTSGCRAGAAGRGNKIAKGREGRLAICSAQLCRRLRLPDRAVVPHSWLYSRRWCVASWISAQRGRRCLVKTGATLLGESVCKMRVAPEPAERLTEPWRAVDRLAALALPARNCRMNGYSRAICSSVASSCAAGCEGSQMKTWFARFPRLLSPSQLLLQVRARFLFFSLLLK